jgi:hypothetical protein
MLSDAAPRKYNPGACARPKIKPLIRIPPIFKLSNMESLDCIMALKKKIPLPGRLQKHTTENTEAIHIATGKW